MQTFCTAVHVLFFLKLVNLPFNYCEQNEERYCFTLKNEIKCENISNIKLNRLDGQETGHTEIFKTEEGRKVEIKTSSIKPLILEIPDFLTKEECQHLIDLAVTEGLRSSETANWSDERRFILQDTDKDKRLSLEEMKVTLMGAFDVHFDKEDLLKMYKDMKLDTDNDEYVTQAEMASSSPKHFEVYIQKFLKSHPEKHSRYSKQVWLWPDTSKDKIFNKIIKRASNLVDLPLELLKLSDFQVVNYQFKGHYHAHWDSSESDISSPCCDKVRKHNCKICRYMTIFFYLNDVEDGGDTAFPVANNDTVDLQEIAKQELFNLNQKCGSPGISIKAEKGKAVIWYNHFVHPENGWLGERDDHTYHGGCPVRNGEKWVANFWIKVTNDKEIDLQRMHKFHEDKKKRKAKKKKDEL